jgi:hypothetical protein
MISEASALRQANRLRLLREFPTSEEAQQELISALRRYALNDDHVIRIIDKWISTSRFSPTPVDISDLAESIPAVDAKPKPDKTCPACLGTGWEHVYTLETYERSANGSAYKRREIIPNEATAELLRIQVDGKTQHVYSCVRRCTFCSYGQALKTESTTRNPDAHKEDPLPVVDESRLHFLDPVDEPLRKNPVSRPSRKPTPIKPIQRITQKDIDRVKRGMEAQRKEGTPE